MLSVAMICGTWRTAPVELLTFPEDASFDFVFCR